MKIKVSEATNNQIDWLVARCEGKNPSLFIYQQTGRLADHYDYCTDWKLAGPIIEREGASIRHFPILDTDQQWGAYEKPSIKKIRPGCHYGSSPLIAAMRCYISSKMMDVVEVPGDLI